MRKVTLILTIVISFLLLSSIVSAQLTPLDIISNFLNSILSLLMGSTAEVQEKVIPSSGTIVYSTDCDSQCIDQGFASGECIETTTKFPAKTVTWTDGTTETIQVGDKGKIYLNGNEGKGFGFILKGSWSNQPSTSVANKMFDWCQDNGVRFMTFIIDAYQSDDDITSRLDFWIPKLYDHEMFMIMWLHPETSTKTSLLDASTYKNKFKLIVDHIISLNKEEMIVAFIGADEWDLNAPAKSITQSELQYWFNDVDPYIRNYLSANNFERPVGYSADSGSASWARDMSYVYSDFVFQNSFIGSDYPSAWDYHWNEKKGWWTNAGKSGYQAWLPSFGYGVGSYADNSKLTPEYFTHHLNYPELSLMTIWYLWEGWYYAVGGEEHYMFDLSGNPYSWTQALAPYFPKYESTSSFKDSIFFEDGAESGNFDAWNAKLEQGGGATDVVFVTSPVHTGTKTIRLTGESATGTARAQLNTNVPQNLDLTEYYWSYWMYLPNNYDIDYYDYVCDAHYYHHLNGNTEVYDFPKTYIGKQSGVLKIFLQSSTLTNLVKEWAPIELPRGEWVHIQFYIKLGVTDGIYRVWQNNVMVVNKINANTATVRNGGDTTMVAPIISTAEVKTYLSSSESNIVTKYVDDLVLSSEKVPEDYRVGEPYEDYGCQSGETSIGQDGCLSGFTCCCS